MPLNISILRNEEPSVIRFLFDLPFAVGKKKRKLKNKYAGEWRRKESVVGYSLNGV